MGSGITRRRLVYTLLALLFSVGLCEELLRVAARSSAFVRYQLSSPLTRNLVPDRALGYRMSPYTGGHDRRGYRNDSAADHYDVLALGDSVTYGLGAFSAGSWPRQLEHLSGRSVYNAGVGGYGPCEYLLVLDELLPLKPTVIIVGLYVGNDIGNAYASVYIQNRCSDLATHDPLVLTAIEAANRHSALSELAAVYGESRPAPPTVLERSAVYGLARSLHYALTTRNQLPNREGRADSFEAAARLPFRVAMASPPAFRTVFRDPRLDLLAVNLEDARMSEGLRITLAALERIRAKAAVNGASLFVALLHSKPFAMAQLIEQQGPDVKRQFEPLIHWEGEVTNGLVAGLSDLAIPTIDTGPALRQAIAGGLMPFHDSDDTHPTDRGYGVIAAVIRQAIGR